MTHLKIVVQTAKDPYRFLRNGSFGVCAPQDDMELRWAAAFAERRICRPWDDDE
jgi:hypothetical protein